MKFLEEKHFEFQPLLWEIAVELENSTTGEAMLSTVEDSPYHREENVWVHTEMTVLSYLETFAAVRPLQENVKAVCSLLFHDTGKPEAEETLERKDGSGTYRRYAGHEQLSAVTFTEFWLKSKKLQDLLSPEEARQVRWMIEHHLPYDLKDSRKRQNLRRAVVASLSDYTTFFDVLRSDAAGRISDDHPAKLQSVEQWITDFSNLIPAEPPVIDESEGTCYILIGASGSGKSSYFREHLQDTVYHSLDMLRIMFFAHANGNSVSSDKSIYEEAWKFCVQNDSDFNSYVSKMLKKDFADADRRKYGVTIDNVNSSRKARARYVDFARQHKMKIVAVEFWNDLETLLSRQNTRSDKKVPDAAVISQYLKQTCADLGVEADEVIIQT